ncbi:MAG: ComF family protein [Chloroflexi bacterium]|nr:ComF family protein [Chloroflexota bacterium]MDA1240745.1 ComF family protein [Chloroflexota bacterium]MQC47908.1 ComF family protein [Chloroflexota bacterium]
MDTESPERSLPRAILDALVDAVLPQRCLVCGAFGASLHPACLATFSRAEGERCIRCWRPGAGTWCERCASGPPDAPAFDGLRAPFRFEGDARRTILEAKFRSITAHLPVLAGAAAEVVPAEWLPLTVTAIPLARRRERQRGYNQAGRAALAIAEALGASYRPRLLRRVRATAPQASLTREQRLSNVAGAFALRRVPPERVLVVDDVTTTGATLSSAAEVLRAAGAVRVYAIALARED